MTLLAEPAAPVSRSRFGLPVVVVHGTTAARQVLIEDAASYGRPWIVKNIMSEALGPMLFTAEGDEWLSHRHAVGPAFAHTALDRTAHVIADTVSDELDQWPGGNIEDVQVDITRLTMRVACRALLGVDPASDPIGRAVDQHFAVVLDWITTASDTSQRPQCPYPPAATGRCSPRDGGSTKRYERSSSVAAPQGHPRTTYSDS